MRRAPHPELMRRTARVETWSGDPEVDSLQGEADAVKVVLVSTRRVGGPGDMDCMDAVTVRLPERLGDRPVVDLTTGDEVP